MATLLRNDDQKEDENRYFDTHKSLYDAESNVANDNDYVNDGIKDIENYANNPSGAVRDGEKKPRDPANPMNFQSAPKLGAAAERKQSVLLKITGKKAAPSLIVIIAVLFGGVGLSSLFAPAILLVHMKEVLVGKLDKQVGVMDRRSSAVIQGKMRGTTVGCGKISIIKCKYTSMSKYQVEKLKAAGVTVETDKSLIPGYSKVKSMNFKGINVPPEGFDKLRSLDSNFHAAISKAYDPRLYGNADYKFKALAASLGISKATNGLENASSDSDKDKAIRETTKSGNKSSDVKVKIDAECDKSGECTTSEGKGKTSESNVNSAENAANSINDEASQVAKDGEKSTSKLVGKLGSGISNVKSSLTSFFRLDGAVSDVCSVRGTLLAIGYAGKTVRALQMARYAMVFLTTADMIKAGTAKESDVSYLGNVLTKTTTDSNGNMSLSATDSAGYKYAADGDISGFSKNSPDNNVSQFMAGGGLSGALIGVSSMISGFFGSKANAKATCGIVNNPWVSIGSTLAGVAVALLPGGQAISAGKLALQAGVGVAFGIAIIMLPSMLADAVAGVTVDSSTYGAAAGDAITSGTGVLESRSAQAGGGAPLTVPQAVAYDNMSKATNLAYAQDDRLSHSPLDATNQNTFMGSIVNQLIPVASSTASAAGTLASIGSVAGSSLLNALVPSTQAASSTAEYSSCTDEDYQDLNLATDPFCNVIYGLPDKYMDMDPSDVIDRLGNQVDQTTGEPATGSDYATFVSQCTNRMNGSDYVPLGYDDSSGVGDGSNCTLTDANIAKNPLLPYYYVHEIDQRVRNGMDNEEPVVDGDDGTDSDGSDASGSDSFVDAGSGGAPAGDGKQQTGSNMAAYQSLSGATFGDKVNAAGPSKLASLAAGTFSFSNFAFGTQTIAPENSAFGADISAKGIVGAGAAHTTVEMTANTSNKAGDVPTGNGNGGPSQPTNNLSYVILRSPGATVDGLTILGTDQGHLYNGIRYDGVANPVLSNTVIKNIPGNSSANPGETFFANFQRVTGTATVKSVTISGGGGAAGLGMNSSSATFNINNLYVSGLKYSAGIALWQQTGTVNIHNWTNADGPRALGAERLGATVNLYDPNWAVPSSGHDITYTPYSGYDGRINFYFSSADKVPDRKIVILTNTSSVKSTVHVYIGGVEQAQSTYVTWQGA